MPTQEQWDEFWSMGDVNRDGYINGLDMELLQNVYGCFEGEPCYNVDCDLNKDGIVDMQDVSPCSMNQGLDIWAYYGVPKDGTCILLILIGIGALLFFNH